MRCPDASKGMPGAEVVSMLLFFPGENVHVDPRRKTLILWHRTRDGQAMNARPNRRRILVRVGDFMREWQNADHARVPPRRGTTIQADQPPRGPAAREGIMHPTKLNPNIDTDRRLILTSNCQQSIGESTIKCIGTHRMRGHRLIVSSRGAEDESSGREVQPIRLATTASPL